MSVRERLVSILNDRGILYGMRQNLTGLQLWRHQTLSAQLVPCSDNTETYQMLFLLHLFTVYKRNSLW